MAAIVVIIAFVVAQRTAAAVVQIGSLQSFATYPRLIRRERDPAAYKQRSFELSVAGYFADPSRAHDLTPFRVVGRVQQSVWASLGDFDLRPALAELDLAALVVPGRQDTIPLASSVSVAEALRARLVVLENCGHVPYVEQPQSLFDAVRQFLTELSPVR